MFPPDMLLGEGDIRRRAGAMALDDEYDGRCNQDGGLALFVGWTKPLKWRRTGQRWDGGSGRFAHHVILYRGVKSWEPRALSEIQ